MTIAASALRLRLPIAIVHDLLVIPAAWLGALWLRFNLDAIPAPFLVQALRLLPVIVVIQGSVFLYFGLYRGVWRFTSLPDLVRAKYRTAFEIDPLHCLRMTASRGKWIDQSQSHNVFMRGTSGQALSDIYRTAWRLGLKTIYYLRTLAASQVEKSTLDSRYGFTQKRANGAPAATPDPAPADPQTGRGEVCDLDEDCEACQ